jgi:hypothetical protein
MKNLILSLMFISASLTVHARTINSQLNCGDSNLAFGIAESVSKTDGYSATLTGINVAGDFLFDMNNYKLTAERADQSEIKDFSKDIPTIFVITVKSSKQPLTYTISIPQRPALAFDQVVEGKEMTTQAAGTIIHDGSTFPVVCTSQIK